MQYHIAVMRVLTILLFFAATTFGLDFSSKSNDLDSQSKPNIIFILADDLGYGEVGCVGDC